MCEIIVINIIFSTKMVGTYDILYIDGEYLYTRQYAGDIIKIKVVVKSKKSTHESVFSFSKMRADKNK